MEQNKKSIGLGGFVVIAIISLILLCIIFSSIGSATHSGVDYIDNTSSQQATQSPEPVAVTNPPSQLPPTESDVISKPKTLVSKPVSQPQSVIVPLKTAIINFDKYSFQDFTTQGVINDLVPPMGEVNPNYIVWIQDLNDSQYQASFNVDSVTYASLTLGETVQVTGTLRGGVNNIKRFIKIDGSVTVVGQSSQVPSATSVLAQTQTILQQHQGDIATAFNNVNTSTSFSQCMSVERRLENYMCAAANLTADCPLPYSYKDSMNLLNNATESLLTACVNMWPPSSIFATSTAPAPKINVANANTVYTPVTVATFSADPLGYEGQSISVTGTFSAFIPRTGATGSTNFIVIADPSGQTTQQVAIEVDDNNFYSAVVSSIQSQSNTTNYFIQVNGTAMTSQSFTETTGLGIQATVTAPVVKANLVQQCRNAIGTGCILISSIFNSSLPIPPAGPYISTSGSSVTYASTTFESYNADPLSYVGQNISVIGMSSLFIPRTSDAGSSNFVIITDPFNSSKPQIAIELDNNSAYSSAIGDLQNKSNPIQAFVRASGTATSSQSFIETNTLGLQQTVNVPVLHASQLEQCHGGSLSVASLTDDNLCKVWVLEYNPQ